MSGYLFASSTMKSSLVVLSFAMLLDSVCKLLPHVVVSNFSDVIFASTLQLVINYFVVTSLAVDVLLLVVSLRATLSSTYDSATGPLSSSMPGFIFVSILPF